MTKKSAQTERRIEDALTFLVGAMAKQERRSKKNVVLHSLRVAYRLLGFGYGDDVVVAGLLHDVLERTSVTQASLSARFGAEVGCLAACVTKDRRIPDPMQRYLETVRRCAAYGEEALAIRTVDLIDNCDRLTALFQLDRLERIVKKLELLEAVGQEAGLNRRLLKDLSLRLEATTWQVARNRVRPVSGRLKSAN